MDSESFLLQAIAGIGVSLAGFAGIIGALAGEKLRHADPEVWLPFWVMISSALSIVFAALFPFLPHYLGAPLRGLWAASSAFVTLLTAGNLAFFSPRFLRAQRDGVLARTRAFSVLMHFISFFLLVSQVLNLLGIGLSRSAGGFLLGLYLMLLVSALNFVFLLYVVANPHNGSPGGGSRGRNES